MLIIFKNRNSEGAQTSKSTPCGKAVDQTHLSPFTSDIPPKPRACTLGGALLQRLWEVFCQTQGPKAQRTLYQGPAIVSSPPALLAAIHIGVQREGNKACRTSTEGFYLNIFIITMVLQSGTHQQEIKRKDG